MYEKVRGSPLQYALGYVFMLPGPVALLVWFVLVLPVYYVVALSFHFAMLVGACILLGATSRGLVGGVGTDGEIVPPIWGCRNPKFWTDEDGPCDLGVQPRFELDSNYDLWKPDNTQTLGAVSIAVLAALTGRAFYQESSQMKADGCRAYFGVGTFQHFSVWDAVDLCIIVLTTVIIWLVITHKMDPLKISQIAVVNTIFLWFRVVQMLSGSFVTAKYVSMFFAVTSDMSSFLVMIIIFIVANGFSLMLLFPTNLHWAGYSETAKDWTPTHPEEMRMNVGTLARSMYTSFDMMMGGFNACAPFTLATRVCPAVPLPRWFWKDVAVLVCLSVRLPVINTVLGLSLVYDMALCRELLNDAYSPGLAWAVFFLFVLIVNIVMLNLLIALMGGTYQRVHEKSNLETLRNRAKLILEYEKNMSAAEREGEKWHPRYLHFLVPKSDSVLSDEYNTADERAESMKKQMQHVMDKVDSFDLWRKDVDKKISAIDAKIDEKIGSIEPKMDKKISAIETKIDSSMAEIKSLLQEAIER